MSLSSRQIYNWQGWMQVTPLPTRVRTHSNFSFSIKKFSEKCESYVNLELSISKFRNIEMQFFGNLLTLWWGPLPYLRYEESKICQVLMFTISLFVNSSISPSSFFFFLYRSVDSSLEAILYKNMHDSLYHPYIPPPTPLPFPFFMPSLYTHLPFPFLIPSLYTPPFIPFSYTIPI